MDVQELLKAAKQLFEAEGSICKETFRHEDLHAGSEKVVWKNKSFGTVLFCEGFRVRENPWFGWIPMEPARGEIQTIRAKNSLPEGILNRGKWLKPVENGIYQAGATYSWEQLESKPNALELQEMQTGLGAMVHQRLEVLERKIGVRPAT
ncbi:uncharacterized protein METZ01_LOCUS350292, partial [marine metagenome]